MSTYGNGGPGRDGHDHDHGQHGGNDAVNGSWNSPSGHRPEDGAPGGPGASGSGGGGFDAGSGGGFGGGSGGGLDADERALRAMMQGAVHEIQPSDAALDRLRHAVPARRARKRQAVVGLAAAAVLVGTGVPALLHMTNAPGSDDQPSAVGHTSQVPGNSGHTDGGRDGHDKERPTDPGGHKDKDGEKGTTGGGKGDETGGGATQGADPSDSGMAPAAACTADQLGDATSNVGERAADGKVYGSFRVANVSATGCTVSGSGSVTVEVQGAAQRSRVGVSEVAPGDTSAGLPAAAGTPVRLEPGQAYEVHFAWVPSDGCQGDGNSPDPTPSEGDEDGDEPGVEPQGAPGDGTADGSVALSHTAEPGAPATSATISDACAGTVYRTGVMAAS